ncbi:MAG: hypothetical protein HY897_07010 [Deltaproteobacteria bacterium]|nr:hypothetical protein [Deltaproteobacteria bacterium]
MKPPFVSIGLSVRLGEITRFLGECGTAVAVSPEGNDRVDEDVTGIRSDTAAEAGHISWVSANLLAKDPARLPRFRGAILIGPEGSGARLGRPVPFVLVECRRPRLAMIRVIQRFFAALAETEWPDPAVGQIQNTSTVHNSARLQPGAVIGSGVCIGENVTVGPNSVVAHCLIGARVAIGANCTLGFPGFGYEKDEDGRYVRFPHVGRVVIGDDVEIGSNTCIDRGGIGDTVIEDGAKIDNLVHVAHNVRVGKNSIVIANTMIGGSVEIGDDCWIAPSVSLLNKITVGNGSVAGMGANVIRDVEPGATVVGNPAKPISRK